TPRTFIQALISGLVPSRAEYSGRNSTTYGATTSAPVNAGEYTLTITPTDSNYTGSGSTNFVVAKAALTLTGISGIDKAYNGNRTADINGLASLAGKIGSDDVALTGALNYQFDDPNVGTDKVITVSGGSLSGAAAANYTLSYPTDLKANITAKNLTITGISIADKEFDGTTTATISGTASYLGLQGTDNFAVAGTPTAAFLTPDVGTNKQVTVSGYVAPSANYTVTQPIGLSADITPAVNLDTDGDGLSDAEEATLGTNPSLADTDGDGVSDGAEVRSGTNPLLKPSFPANTFSVSFNYLTVEQAPALVPLGRACPRRRGFDPKREGEIVLHGTGRNHPLGGSAIEGHRECVGREGRLKQRIGATSHLRPVAHPIPV
ncbi:MAG: hypothetical protein EBZ05_09755, partial [Verrucomicrobia bacterium]|nr:hypothetical protein [Verrucomicrobiota bacterium]